MIDQAWHNGVWYFVTKIVLTYYERKDVLVIENFFLKFEFEGKEFAKTLIEITRTIC